MSKTHLFDLDGKIAFVSGASRGIGEAIAKLLAQQGAHVIVSSRKIDGCQAVADAITAEGGKATAIACHIGEMEQIRTSSHRSASSSAASTSWSTTPPPARSSATYWKPTSAPSRRPSTSTSAATTSCPSRAAS